MLSCCLPNIKQIHDYCIIEQPRCGPDIATRRKGGSDSLPRAEFCLTQQFIGFSHILLMICVSWKIGHLHAHVPQHPDSYMQLDVNTEKISMVQLHTLRSKVGRN